MKRIHVLYYDHCTDGFGAAYAAWRKWGNNAEYIPLNYGQITSVDALQSKLCSPLSTASAVYILDFSLPIDVMLELRARAGLVVWLDHHKTSFEAIGKRVEDSPVHRSDDNSITLLDNSKSGAMLAWEHFCSGRAPSIIEHIDDRDRWQFALDNSREVHAALSVMAPWSFEQWHERIVATETSHDAYMSFVDSGALVLAAYEQEIERTLGSARPCLIKGKHGLVVNSQLHQSEIGNRLAQRSGTYGLVWYVGSDGAAKCSLRSIGDYDVSAMAAEFGGGGHKNAAGFSVPMHMMWNFLLGLEVQNA